MSDDDDIAGSSDFHEPVVVENELITEVDRSGLDLKPVSLQYYLIQGHTFQ